MKDTKTKEQFVTLRASGLSFDRIATELGVSKRTLIEWSKGLERDIANLKAVSLDALQEKYYLQKEQRIKLFGEHLERVHQELMKRPMTEMATDKLLDMFLKLMASQGQERVDIQFRSPDRVMPEKWPDETWTT